mgnify:FL=1
MAVVTRETDTIVGDAPKSLVARGGRAAPRVDPVPPMLGAPDRSQASRIIP